MRKIPIQFLKMHGAGNDFVFLTPSMLRRPMTSQLARLLLDRHFGIGGDQLLYLKKQTGNTLPLDFYNSDGSQAEMCGNGARAAAYYLSRFKKMTGDFTFLTKRGSIGISQTHGKIVVDMGEPILDGERIPVKLKGDVIDHPLTVGGQRFKIHSLSMGNPHCVIFVNDIRKFPVALIGPKIEHHSFFPNRVNVEFVQILSRSRVRVRVWERGAGETLACGTGACAVSVAGARVGKTSRRLAVELPGGTLSVRWENDNHVYLSGPAEVTYEGRFYV